MKNKLKTILYVILLNGIILSILCFLQYLKFFFLRAAIDPATNQCTRAHEIVNENDKILIIEALFFLIFIGIINKKMLHKKFKKYKLIFIFFMLVDIIYIVISLIYISRLYLNGYCHSSPWIFGLWT